MDLISLDQIALNQVSTELIADATALAVQVNDRRPLPAEVIEKIQKELLGERVYNSNAIEGNTLTLRETKRILDTGSIVDVGKKREATEVLNLGKAIEQVQALVSNRSTWASLENLTKIHRTLMTDVLEYGTGTIRSERVMITGAIRQPPRPEKLDELLRLFSIQLAGSQNCEPIKLATWTHWAIARLHPFMDGNGRMARLWQDLILSGNRFTAAVIRHEDRKECRLSPPLFFTVFGAAVFIIGTFPGSFPIACLRKLTALLPAEDLGGMIMRKKAIAGLEQAAALR